MKKITIFNLIFFFTIYIYADSTNIITVGFSKQGPMAFPPIDTIKISIDNTTKYNVDISDNKRDTCNYLGFMPWRGSCVLFIDSILVFNDNDTLLLDGFEEYDTVSLANELITNDKEWHIEIPTGTGIKYAILYRNKGKCLRVWYYMGDAPGFFFLKFNNNQNYSKYHTLQLSISRIHPDSTATSLKNEILSNNTPCFFKLTYQNTILYTVPPGNHKTVIELYSISGKKIKTLFTGYKQEGDYPLSLKVHDIGTGLYYLRAMFGEQKATLMITITH